MDDAYTFFEKVFVVAREVPYGRVTSYGAIARFLGTGKSARMVGYAMNQSFKAIPPVPAHRVLNRNGLLTGKMHFETPTTMQEWLEAEGISVIGDQVQDHNDIFWDPNDHLSYEELFSKAWD